MIDYLRSESLKRYYQENNISLTQEQVASLIYNANASIDDIYDSLNEFVNTLTDKYLKLKNEIVQEITNYKIKRDKFIIADKDVEFVLLERVTSPVLDDIDLRIYSTYNEAFNMLKYYVGVGNNINKYTIEKRKRFNNSDKINEPYSTFIGQITFDENYKCKTFWYDEEQNMKMLTKEDKDNFMLRFQYLPSPWRKGQPVRCISNNKLYITDDYNSEEEKIAALSRFNGYEDFWDNVIFCWYLDNNNQWQEEHILPTNLEYDFSDNGMILYTMYKNNPPKF